MVTVYDCCRDAQTIFIDVIHCILTDQVQRYLLYPHSWVRLVSCRLMGLLFGSSDIEEITMALSPSNNNTCNDTTKKKKVWLRFFVDGGGLFRVIEYFNCMILSKSLTYLFLCR